MNILVLCLFVALASASWYDTDAVIDDRVTATEKNAQQFAICGTLPSFYGIICTSPGAAYTDYVSICNLFGMGVANISYTDLSTMSTLLSSCGQASGGMWLNAVEGYTDNNCMIFINQYILS